MRSNLLLLAVALAAPAAPGAQHRERPPKPEIACYSGFGSNGDLSAKTKELWDGYKISFAPAPHSEKDSEDACMAAIYDRSGKEVYRTIDIDVILDRAAGMDVDGDGTGDAVLMHGSSGGSGGSWDIEVISLKPEPHVLFTFNQDFPPADFRKDSQQRVVLWSGWGGNAGFGYFMAHANFPSTPMVFRFTDGKLRDVTPEFCSDIEDGQRFPTLSEPNVEHFKTSKIDSDAFETFDDEQTAGRVLSFVLHYVFCRRFDNALGVIHEMWPKQDQATLIERLRKKLSNVESCPECAKEIGKWR
jgi:hypothetical protein